MKYTNILLKLSGELLMGNQPSGLDPKRIAFYANEIEKINQLGIKITIIIGGGNLHRGVKKAEKLGIGQVQSDYMGMLATTMNGIALASALNKQNIPTQHMSSIAMAPICEQYIPQKGIDELSKGNVLILSAGLGIPYFTTDSAASLRALELKADVMIKGTKVDGIYNKDPKKHTDATRYSQLTFQEAYHQNLAVLDKTAFALCEMNKLPIIVFNATHPNDLLRIVQDESIGTIVL